MNSAENSRGVSWSQEAGQFRAELGRMLELRRDLASLEINRDRQLIRRCLIGGTIGAVLALVGLPLLLQSAAQGLADVTTLGATTWTLIMGSVLLAPGLLLLARTISKFRSDFCGLRDTLAELNEDLIWLREWIPSEAGDPGENSAPEDEAN